jgi:hypothetical protein
MNTTVSTIPTPAAYAAGRKAYYPQEEEGDTSSTRSERWCGASLAVPSTEARTGMCEVEVVKRLLDHGNRDPLTRVQLERMIGGNPLDPSDALHNLAAVGVICLSEESVTLAPAPPERYRLPRG